MVISALSSYSSPGNTTGVLDTECLDTGSPAARNSIHKFLKGSAMVSYNIYI